MAVAIKEVIQNIIEKMSYMNGYKRAWLEKNWITLVGEEAGKHSKPYKIERDILLINVDSSVWNQELFMIRASLIVKINQKFARKIVEDIKYQIGHFPVMKEIIEFPSNGLVSSERCHRQRDALLWDKVVLMNIRKKKKIFSASIE